MGDLDKPKESSEQRAKRMWFNHDLTKRVKEAKQSQSVPEKTIPEIAEVITTERIIPDVTTKFERQLVQKI